MVLFSVVFTQGSSDVKTTPLLRKKFSMVLLWYVQGIALP